MMMLLDWSGSMSDILSKTVDQLINLVYFCQNIIILIIFMTIGRFELISLLIIIKKFFIK